MGEATFSLPGYVVDALLGFGASGEVWSAREVATGERVALKRLRGDAGSGQRLRREAALLAGVQHPHLVRLRAVVAEPEVVLVLDHAAGGSLAALLAARRRLSPGEIVTVGVPVAQALAEAHRRGVVHGDVSPGNVLFTVDGRPLLADLGVARLVGETRAAEATCGFADPLVLAGGAPTPSSDVYALAAVCRTAVSGGLACEAAALPRALLAALDAGDAADPAQRPTAAEFAGMLHAACPAEPVRLVRPGMHAVVSAADRVTHAVARGTASDVVPDTAPDGGRGRHRRGDAAGRRSVPWGRGAAMVGAPAALAGAVALGVAWADAGSAPTAAVRAAPAAPATSAPVADAWAVLLRRLDAQRSAAFASGSTAPLASVYAAGSPALQRDSALLGRLRAAGVVARGLRLDLRAAVVQQRTPTRVVLHVRDVLPAYSLVDRRSGQTHAVAGRGERHWRVTLLRQQQQWRIAEVTAG